MNKKVDKKKNVKNKGVTVSKVTLLFFCVFFALSSLSIFMLGVYVGRGEAPITFKINDIRAEIASIGTGKEVAKVEKKPLESDKTEKKTKPEKKKNKKKVEKKQKKSPAVTKPKVNRKKSKSVFSIQIGAFKFETDADALVKKLKSENIPAFKYVNKGSSEIWYRVRVGSFKRREDAKKLLLKLKNKKFDAYLVR
jgi:cell division protein FtsN